jgi:TonB family protein
LLGGKKSGNGGGGSTTTGGGGGGGIGILGGGGVGSGSGGGSSTAGTGSGSVATPSPPDASPFSQPPVDAAPAPADPPKDPPKPLSRADEIDRQSSKSAAKFDRCKSQAADARPADRPLEGEVVIAFQVTAAGDVKNAAVVSDSTDAPELGGCLLAVIQSWQLSSGGGGTDDFSKSFRYRR